MRMGGGSKGMIDSCTHKNKWKNLLYRPSLGGNTRSEGTNTRIPSQAYFCENSNLEYARIHVIYRVNQAEYAIRIPVATREYGFPRRMQSLASS